MQGQAGHYGAYECDLPMTTFRLLVDHLKKLDPQPDFIIYTGAVVFCYPSMHVIHFHLFCKFGTNDDTVY